jgi:hypothetical protein
MEHVIFLNKKKTQKTHTFSKNFEANNFECKKKWIETAR